MFESKSATKQFGGWLFICDRAATEEAYIRTMAGGADPCGCDGCRNFRLVRHKVFLAEFIALLASLGIDPRKDGEVYHTGEMAPNEHHYGGWFHFVGTLERTGDFPMVELAPGFEVCMCRRGAPALQSLKDLPLVQLEFQATRVPWVLNTIKAVERI